MTAAIRSWWTGLSAREQVLVSIAGALAGALAGWFLIYLPLTEALARAHIAHGEALERHGAVSSRAALLETGGGGRSATLSAAPVAQLAIQLAAEAGLPLARNDPAGDDGAALAISSGRSPAVLGLLAAFEQQGVRPADLTIRPNGDGTVNLVATMRRAGR